MPEFRRFPSGQDALSQATLNDNTLVPCRYQEGTANDSDKSIPFSILNSTPVAVCNSSADSVQKVATVDNFPDFTLTNGREVSVYFANGNTATSPSFNLNNTGAIALGLENQASSVSIGSGCWGGGVWLTLKYVDITVAGNRIQKWIIKGHDVASISNGVTTKADGTTVYNTQSVDSALINYQKQTVLTPQDINFNNFQEQGLYATNRLDMNSGAWVSIAWENAPTSKPLGGFSLIVIKEGNYIKQFYSRYDDSSVYVRQQKYNQGRVIWSEWTNIYNRYSFTGKTLDLTQLSNGKWIAYITLLVENHNDIVEFIIQKTASNNAYIKVISNTNINVSKSGMILTLTGDSGVYSNLAVWSVLKINESVS